MTVVALLALGWGLACSLPLLHRAATATARARLGALGGRVEPAAGRWAARGSASIVPRVARAVARSRVAMVARGLWTRVRRRDRHRVVERGVPLALDVLTMAARAGYTPRLALAAAARWSPADVGVVLGRVEQRCALGAPLTTALDELGREEPALRALADALVVAERSGAPIADLLARVADDARSVLRRRAEAHARRVPVRLLFPLVFLVLPAFGLLTVVPALAAGLRHP